MAREEWKREMALKLGYWKIRGVLYCKNTHSLAISKFSLCQLAQPIRLLLNYTGTEFEDVQYEQGDGTCVAGVYCPHSWYISFCSS